MRVARVGLMVAALLVLFGTTATFAFHEGGVATCTRCHSMHGALSSENTLLANVDSSSTCLNCHEASPGSYHISTASASAGTGIPPAQRTPGGDFRWLSKTYSYATGSRSGTNNGREHGHNIIAAGANSSSAPYGYVADTTNTIAPGGTMSSSALGCASCHDPHGQSRRDEAGNYVNPGADDFADLTYPPIEASGSYGDPVVPEAGYALGAYRLLGGPGYEAFGTTTFPGAPIAIVPSSYNQDEDVDQIRVAYGTPSGTSTGTATWAEWCGTCHPSYHIAATGTFVHPTNGQLGDLAENYDKYVKTGDLTGTNADSFSSLVPFAENTDNYAVLASHANNDSSYLNGPSGDDRVTCLTCHRAHASAWDNILRWNQSAELLTVADEVTGVAEYPAIDNEHSGEGSLHRGYSEAEMTAAYYGREATVFAGYQRSLCNKCHIKD